MELREQRIVSLARSGAVTLPAAAGHGATLLDPVFLDGAEGALADDARDARPQAIGARFSRLRFGTALAPTRQ